MAAAQAGRPGRSALPKSEEWQTAAGLVWAAAGRADTSLTSCRAHAMRSRAASGWSPNSWAIRLAQPLMPSCLTVRLITSVTVWAVG